MTSSALQWDLYTDHASRFAAEWAHEMDEKGEAHSFWDEFLHIFNIRRRQFARHEARAKRSDNRRGFIDLFWPGKLLVEHKAGHKNKAADFDEALRQAMDYIGELSQKERPQKLVLCNFKTFRLYDVSEKDFPSLKDLESLVLQPYATIPITELPQHIRQFAFLLDFAGQMLEEEEKASIEAAQRISNLHNVLSAAGYKGTDLELLLVRVLFCLFAEDTGIFGPKQFSTYIALNTQPNGKDTGDMLELLFEVLNTPPKNPNGASRSPNLAPALQAFPYVNGGLFSVAMERTPPGDAGFRMGLLECGKFDWSSISPEIFGSLFQEVLTATERRSLGAHYTSEKNILRLIEPLFLDELREEFKAVRKNEKKLAAFRGKLHKLRFLDPACGCGNFLVVTYRELRLLDLEVVRAIRLRTGQLVTNTDMLKNVWLTQFHGLEIKPVSALIAQTALWLTEHQCNRLLEQHFGIAVPTIPLDETPDIRTGNALAMDWKSLTSASGGETFSYILGNPPFIGSKMMDAGQREEIKALFDNAPGSGTLDYVTGWYRKAAQYMDAHPGTVTAYVSTNSISQGEQVGALWGTLLGKHGVQIHFAHQTFKWFNEAPGIAAVYCIIVGFGKQKPARRLLFEYADIKGEPTVSEVKNINPYFVDAPNVVITSRQKPICDVPEIGIGNKPIDGGHYLFTTEEKAEFLKIQPEAARYFRRWIGSDEFINGYERWCLWLGEETMEVLQTLPEIWKRVEAVRQVRLASVSAPTQKLAQKPTRFHVENMPKGNYLVVPKVSSERRRYIPIGYESPETLSSDLVFIIPNASLYHFGVLQSEMHMAWVRCVCGRLESRYRYSKDIVYNNFPFPDAPEAAAVQAVEAAAQGVLEVRKVNQAGGKSLADLYDPLKMPAELLAAHQRLDRAVDGCYGIRKGFQSEARRVGWLFERWGELCKNV